MAWPILLVVAVLAAAALIVRRRHATAMAMVRADLERAGARDVAITPVWLDFDRDTLTYNVRYTSAEGTPRANRCKVPASPLADRSVFWAEPI